MTATAPSPTPTSRGTRIEQAERQLAALNVELAEVNARLAQSPQAEHEARLEAIAKTPAERSNRLGGPVARLLDRRRKDERKLPELAAEIAAVERFVTEQRQLHEAEQIAVTIGVAKRLAELVGDAYKEFKTKVDPARETWDTTLVPALEALDAFRVENETEHPELREDNAWLAAVATPVEPAPAEFLAAVLAVETGALGAHPAARRAALTKIPTREAASFYEPKPGWLAKTRFVDAAGVEHPNFSTST